jgi:hypothetical protein
MDQHLNTVRKKAPRKHQSTLTDEDLEGCEKSYTAAKGDTVVRSSDKFDDSGIFVLICKHDIPLVMANIDTPGEKQKYIFALLNYFFMQLPPTATVVTFYDIGCIIDRSRVKVRPR